jgi:hypothetical protein
MLQVKIVGINPKIWGIKSALSVKIEFDYSRLVLSWNL